VFAVIIIRIVKRKINERGKKKKTKNQDGPIKSIDPVAK